MFMYQFERQYLIESRRRVEVWKMKKGHVPFPLLPVPNKKKYFFTVAIISLF